MLIAVAAIRLSDLFAVVMLFGVYSLLTAALFMDLDAVDVAFTEAAVGAGVTRFQPGDEIFGYLSLTRNGGYAEYARVPAGWIVPMPDGLEAPVDRDEPESRTAEIKKKFEEQGAKAEVK